MAAITASRLAFFTLVFLSVRCLHGSRILMSAGVDQTHYIFSAKIGRELVERGHHVTFLLSSTYSHRLNSSDTKWFQYQVYPSPYTPQDVQLMRDRLGLVALNGTYQNNNNYANILFDRLFKKAGKQADVTDEKPYQPLTEVLKYECNLLLSNHDVIYQLSQSNFDLMTFDVVNPCMALLAQKLSLPFVIITAQSMVSGVHDRWFNVPNNPAYVPMFMSTSTHDMTFRQRLVNTATWLIMATVGDRFMLGPYDELKTKYNIRTDLNLRDTLGNAELWISNTHFAMEYPRPLNPNLIFVGGLSADDPRPLNEELKEFFDGSGSHGVIIFSLGSVVEVMNEAQSEIVAGALARLPQRVLWRNPGIPPKNLGVNTKLVSWLPQNDVLGHPMTRLLIYHGGTNGILEAIYHGVPVMVIPLFGEHYDCAIRLKARGMAKIVMMEEFTQQNIYETAVHILNNSSYTRNARRWSAVIKHNVAPPLHVAAHWIEHVMLYGGDHLRTKARSLSVVQYYLLDVLAMMIVVIFSFVAFVLIICWSLFRRHGNKEAKKVYRAKNQ